MLRTEHNYYYYYYYYSITNTYTNKTFIYNKTKDEK